MYKLLLCWRYLRTRYIALASVISVMLGVATMILVNSVMAGFAHEMRDRIHGILSDLVFESHSLEGFRDPQWHMDQIRQIAGDDIAGMTATVHVPAMLSFQVRGQWITRQITLIGVDEHTHSSVSDFGKFLQHPDNQKELSFLLRENGYSNHGSDPNATGVVRPGAERWGWDYRRNRAMWEKSVRESQAQIAAPAAPSDQRVPRQPGAAAQNAPPSATADDPLAGAARSANTDAAPVDPFQQHQPQGTVFDSSKDQHCGIVLGIALSAIRSHDGVDHFLVVPGDDVKISFPTAGTPPKIANDNFTVVDFYESKMSEYDSNFVFVPIRRLQELRGMIDPSSDTGFATSIQIKTKPGVDAQKVRDKIRAAFTPELYGVYTWQDKQGPLLSAVQMETSVLNILLFNVIAVSGFGILAIFFMIVVEKTRDVGVLKSLGASSRGVLSIFLTYGMSLGAVGAGSGMLLGLLLVRYLDKIRVLIEWITGERVFDPAIYYFYKIPTIVDPFTVGWIVSGALIIAVLASVLPALRAAKLHPVEALRYE